MGLVEGVFGNGREGIWEQLVEEVFGDGGGGIWEWWRGYLELALGFGIFALGFGLNTTAFFYSEWYYRPYTTLYSYPLVGFYITSKEISLFGIIFHKSL